MTSDFISGPWTWSWLPWLLDLECTDFGSADTVDLVDLVGTVDLVASAFKTESPVRRLFGTSIRLNGSDCFLAGSEDC